ncbi:MAG: hypothetical protein B7X59_01145 [Polaromonas sp. 39-63-203]|jgi:hypothetical protein|uniref:DUF4399 domain-containing protein n=1 Tax=Polaromonas sp. TaxID=1869339 RepID=UPI000BCE2D18|nr:DUF4399 domain-containing protein [Polaromonas sp.]OYY53829.1 MAG: hypothetical protein B7Y54_01335 [Polaromonas sp. 35-63-240]OYZ02782.1 MAG: hypothetical protein B7Y42_02200 [Polaromonas sp. 28-63-22]OYZ84875.1 MAG: hypothetical protein B7Y03_01595 [Polaromonas sp. 24-62-144]OZB02252.1 MAG: hypothetical protein B7X59_01145 [Polaromonas sp. 39-63-203]HQS30494.1 DUF4399 domain-containing protein [Polaromonas sp.]
MRTQKQLVLVLASWIFTAPFTFSQAQVPAGAGRAQESPTQLHPWQAALPRLTAEAYFTNLKDGAKIETPFRVTFGLSGGWGLAPISKPIAGKSGHHHLLVNRELPLDFKTALPFNDQYIHFGKGQMETVLTLEPGTYTLRLLLADDKHLPHFVYSKPLQVTVTRKNKDVDPKSLVNKGISLANIEPNSALKGPFRVQFQASGFNVAHLKQKEKDTGHFRLTLTPEKGGKPAQIDLVNGQTEVWLSPPAGAYAMKLDLIDNLDPGRTLAETTAVPVRVE